MIRALTFDIGGTLADGDIDLASYQRELLRYLRGLGFDVGTEEYRRVMGSALRRLAEIRARNIEVKFEEFYSRVLEELRVPLSPEILGEVRMIYGRNFPQTPKPGVREVLRELAESYRLGVVSNTMSGVSRDFLEREGLAGYFEVIVLSRDVGIRKPDPRIFSLALQRLGVEAFEAAHVGNSVEEDVAGAKGAGMKAVLLGGGERRAEVGPDLTIRSIAELPSALRRFA
jgi:HAD superfamily hydrolase (TIGR01549 family)